jgi:hypothetical protein
MSVPPEDASVSQTHNKAGNQWLQNPGTQAHGLLQASLPSRSTGEETLQKFTFNQQYDILVRP